MTSKRVGRTDEASAGPPRGRARSLAVLAAVAVVLYAADQVVKLIIESTMSEGQVIQVLGPVLQWHFVRNPGAAFSFASGQTWIFTLFAAIVVVVIVVLAQRIRSFAWAAVFGLVLGGVLGNLTDRLFREPGFGVGHVVDFISTPWLLPAIYNIADMGIVFGMALFVWLTIRDVRLDGTRGRAAERAGESDAPVTSDLPAPDTDDAESVDRSDGPVADVGDGPAEPPEHAESEHRAADEAGHTTDNETGPGQTT